MSGMRKVIVWFVVCLVLAIYAKTAGFLPGQSSSSGAVLGQQKSPGFGPLLPH